MLRILRRPFVAAVVRPAYPLTIRPLHVSTAPRLPCVGGPDAIENSTPQTVKAQKLEETLCSARTIIAKLSEFHSKLPKHLQTAAADHVTVHEHHREEENKKLYNRLSKLRFYIEPTMQFVRKDPDLDDKTREKMLARFEQEREDLDKAKRYLEQPIDLDPTTTREIDCHFKI